MQWRRVMQEKARQSCWCWTQTGRTLKPVKPTRCHKSEASGLASGRIHSDVNMVFLAMTVLA